MYEDFKNRLLVTYIDTSQIKTFQNQSRILTVAIPCSKLHTKMLLALLKVFPIKHKLIKFL